MSQRKLVKTRLRSVDEALKTFPPLKRWDSGGFDSVDLLIVSAGFEQRVLAFPERLGDAAFAATTILVGRYHTNPEDNAARFSFLRPLLERISSSIRDVDADVPENLLAAVRSLDRAAIKKVAFDISGASANFIFSVIGAVAQTFPVCSLTFFYAEAERYNSSEASSPADAGGLGMPGEAPESGVEAVWINAIFPGRHNDAAPTQIIAFPSLYLARLARCLNFCGEAVESLADRNVFWVLPKTTTRDHQWRRERTIEVVRQLLASPSNDPGAICAVENESQVDCDVLSASDAARVVLGRSVSGHSRNFYLIHMGSKLQAVGSAFSLLARTEIALVYARPQRFNPNSYSSGVGEMYSVHVDNVRELATSLASAGEMVVVCSDGTEIV